MASPTNPDPRPERIDAHTRSRLPDREPKPTPITDLVTPFLAAFGLTNTRTVDTLDDAITSWLTSHQITADVTGLRHGTLTLDADPQNAAFLRYQTQQLLTHLRASRTSDDPHIVRIRVTTRR